MTRSKSQNENDVIETTIYCLNTKKKFVYELRGGKIVSERVIQCHD